MAGYSSSSNYMAGFNGNRAVAPGAYGGGGLGRSSTAEINPNRAIDLDDDAGRGSSSTDFSGISPYTRMVLGHDTGGGLSVANYNILISGNPRAVSGHDRGGVMGRIGQSSESVEAETRQHRVAPDFDHYQMASTNAPQISFRSMSTVVGGDDERAGPSSSGHDQHHPLKRGPEDAAAVGVRIGASSDQRNVRQRFSYDNQQNLASPTNSNHVRPLNADSPFAFLFHPSSCNPAPSMQDASSSSATAMPAYPPLDDDESRQRMQNPSGAEWGNMAQTRTHLHPNHGIHGSNASSSASGSWSEHFHEAYVPIVRGNLVQLTAGPSGNQYRGEPSNQFGPAATPIQDGGFPGTPPTFGQNRRGEPLTGSALVRRRSNIQAPFLRLLGQDVLVDSPSRQAGTNSAPAHQAASISAHRTWPPTNLAPVSQAAASLAPATWLPAYLPAPQAATSLAPANWLPPYLAPAHQIDNNFAPVNWDENDFDEEEEEDDDDNYEDMRLDVDNMSYEELLALEDHIGNVSTGMSEDSIKAKLKEKKYSSFTMGPPVEEEMCCICQEEYEEGEMMGTLDCGHDFHFNCIKQWLVQKNLCPICKTAALA